MGLATGTPLGTLNVQESVYAYGAPNIYVQDATAPPLYNPDGQTFYWGLSGTTTYNVFEIGCPTDVTFSENLTLTDVLCDNLGVVATVQQRNYMEFTMSVQSLFPLATLRILLKGGAVTRTTANHTEKFGFGPVNNNQFWHLYTPQVYDTDVGDYVWMHFHKCQFVDAWSIGMSWGNPWKITGIKMRAYADSTYPSAQTFGMFGRLDASVIV
jgi:hypothetical protein